MERAQRDDLPQRREVAALTSRIGPLLASDLIILAHTMRDDEKDQLCAVLGLPEYDPDVAARVLVGMRGPTYCVLRDGRPVLAAGLEELRPKVWAAWMAGAMEAWESCWRLITKTVIRETDALLVSGDAHRIEILSLTTRTEAHRWYEACGFKPEGVQAKLFADGRDAACHVKLGGA